MVRFIQPEYDDDDDSQEEEDEIDRDDKSSALVYISNSNSDLDMDANIMDHQQLQPYEDDDNLHHQNNDYSQTLDHHQYYQSPHDHPTFNSNYHQPPEKRRISYKAQFMFILLILLLGQFAPPPPPPNESWNDFMVESTETVSKAMKSASFFMWYVVSGCASNFYQEVKSHIADPHGESKEKPSCSMTSLHQRHWNTRGGDDDEQDDIFSMEEYLLQHIIGQDYAIQEIAQYLTNWESLNHSSHDDESTKTSTPPMSAKPHVITLTGSEGVGKRTTANLIARKMFQHCTKIITKKGGDEYIIRHCQDCIEQIPHGILELNGIDYALEQPDGNEQEVSSNRLSTRILEHIHRQNEAGAVIIMNHIDDLSPSSMRDLSRLIHKSNVSFKLTQSNAFKETSYQRWSNTPTRSDQGTSSSEGTTTTTKDVQVLLGNVLFLFTTRRGEDKAFELVRKYRQSFDSIPWTELQSKVTPEIEKMFHGRLNGLVVPFWSLQPSTLRKILQNKILQISNDHHHHHNDQQQKEEQQQKWKLIQLLDSAQNHVLSSKLAEYVQYGSHPQSQPLTASRPVGSTRTRTSSTSKTKSDPIVIFARHGGHYLDSWMGLIEEKIDALSFTSSDDVILVGYEEEKDSFVIDVCEPDSLLESCAEWI